MIQLPKDIISEILKYVNIRQLRKLAFTNSRLNSMCLEHIKTRNLNSVQIQIGNGYRKFKVFVDDELLDMYDFLSKRIYNTVDFFENSCKSFTFLSNHCELKERIQETKLPFPLHTCTKIKILNCGQIQNKICRECGIYNTKFNICGKCKTYYCDVCMIMKKCICDIQICYSCQSYCEICGSWEYCKDCLCINK